LVDVLNKEAGEIINARLIKSDNNNVIISIESKNTGEKNRIKIKGKTSEDEKLFENVGLLRKAEKGFLTLNFDNKMPQNFEFIENGYNNTVSAVIKTKKDYTYLPDRPVQNIHNDNIEFMYNFLPVSVVPEKKEKIRIIKKNIGSVTIKDVVIYGADVILNKFLKKPEKKEERFEQPVIELYDLNDNVQTIKLNYTDKWKKFEEKTTLNSINKIVFKNPSNYDLLLDEFKIYSTRAEKEFKNIAQLPKDAEIKVDGILIKRDKNNELNDVIKDATINLKAETDRPITVEIKEDDEKIKEKINKFVEQYNRIIEFIAEAGKTSESTKPGEYKREDRGILSNDISLMNLQSKLRATVVDAYSTSLGNRLTVLAQIGISTGKWGSVWADIKKGLLKIDEEKLDAALAQFGEKIGEIFGYDSNGDKIIDTGVAYKIVRVLKPYTAPKGLIDGKISLVELMIRNTEERIAKKEEDIEKYEESLKRKFGKMESALQQLKGMSQALDNALENLQFETGGKKKKKIGEEE